MSQPFDDTTKTFYRQFFEQRGLRAITQFEVFARSRAIDLFVECPPDASGVLDDTVFHYFKQFNTIEFKGNNDNLTALDFNRIMMRAWGIGGINEPSAKESQDKTAKKLPFSPKQIAKSPSQRTVTIISVVKPEQILIKLSDEYKFVKTEETGVYKCSQNLFPIWIIHPTELVIKPANYPLLPLARGEKLTQFIKLCIEQERYGYLQLMLDIGQSDDPSFILHKIMEMMNMPVAPIRDETWEFVDQSLRRRPEAVQKIAFLKEIREQSLRLGKDEGLRLGRDEGLRLGKDEGLRLGRDEGLRLGKVRGKQDILISLLHTKFGPISEPIISKIRSTVEAEQLEKWSAGILFVNTLDEMDFEV